MHRSTLAQTDSVARQLLTAYESRLAEQQNAFDALLKNSKVTEQISLSTIHDSRIALEKAQKTLANTQHELDMSQESLDKAKEDMRKARWNSVSKKVMTGAGGIVVGLLVGLLIVR